MTADRELALGSLTLAHGMSLRFDRAGDDSVTVRTARTLIVDGDIATANGDVVLIGGTAARIAGRIVARRGERGAAVHVTAEHVAVDDNALIDVSAPLGAGEALLGGGWRGNDARVSNARRTSVAAGARIAADATSRGNGGTVVVWSDNTRMYGAISARGGPDGGDGGNVETSGGLLDMQGHADTRAPKGAVGQLLLDPSNIWIANSSSNATTAGAPSSVDTSASFEGPPVFNATGTTSDSLLLTGVLVTALGSSSVRVTTHSGGAGTGFIRVLDPVTWSNSNTLILDADNGIQISSRIANSYSGGARLVLNGGFGNIVQTGSAGLELGMAGSLWVFVHPESPGGSVRLTGANFIGTIAGSAPGSFEVRNQAPLTVGTVSMDDVVFSGLTPFPPLSGVHAGRNVAITANSLRIAESVSGSGVALSALGTSDLDLQASIDAQGGIMTLQAGGDVLFNAAGGLSLAGANGTATAGPGHGVRQAQGTTDIGMPLSANRLVLDGGTITGSGDITVTSELVWNAATLAGTGALNLGGSSTISAPRALTRRTNVSGVLALMGAGNLNTSGDGNILNVVSGGRFDLQGGGAVTGDGASPETINVAAGGTFVKSGGAPSLFENVSLTNSTGGNIVVAPAQSLQFGAGVFTSNSGTITLGSGAVLSTNGLVNNPGGVIEGAGLLDVGGGALVNQGTLKAGGSSNVGTLSIGGELDMAAGTIEAELFDAATYDVVAVSGPITVTPTTAINPVLLPGSLFDAGTEFDIVRKTGAAVAVAGTLASPPGFIATTVASPPAVRIRSLQSQPAPVVGSVTPTVGPIAGGQSVTVTGSALAGGLVRIGGNIAAVTANSATSVTFTTPAHAAGAVDIVVTNGAGGVVTATNGYTYLGIPVITGVAPNKGTATGGESVSITGNNLSFATSVTFGGAAATITSSSLSLITVKAPAHAAGPVDIVVITPGGSGASAKAYSYTGGSGGGGPPAPGNGITIAFSSGDVGCALTASQFIPLNGNNPASPPRNTVPKKLVFPYDLLDVAVSGCLIPGASVQLVIRYPQPLPAGTQYWVYGPTPSDASPHWYVLPVIIAGDTITLTIADGGVGDDELPANRSIGNLGGPAAPK